MFLFKFALLGFILPLAFGNTVDLEFGQRLSGDKNLGTADETVHVGESGLTQVTIPKDVVVSQSL